ncbi:MAG: 4-hydroxy-3-methylbut-2-enyl diphosphate reductase [Bacteroidota bacterium]|nr:4-hydroxy-3-methylbut-2-enyl diphosphate reductase [Bacteroidota bacterium]
MTITVDPYAGFCWGVVRTIRIAEEELARGNALVCLGDLIHNPQELARLKRLGLRTVAHEDLSGIPPGTKILVRAHGEPPETYRRARDLGLEVIDATCPVVTRLQERIRRYADEGYQVVIFGKKDHAEVVGLRGVIHDACVVVKNAEEAMRFVDPHRKTVLFSQTTMDKPTFNAVREAIETLISSSRKTVPNREAVEFQAKDTICGQVAGREHKLREFAVSNDVVLFVAGKNSSNGQVLFDICRKANSRSHFIEDETEISLSWFEGAERIGISGATSTPKWLMAHVAESIVRSVIDALPREESKSTQPLPFTIPTTKPLTFSSRNGFEAAVPGRERKTCFTKENE